VAPVVQRNLLLLSPSERAVAGVFCVVLLPPAMDRSHQAGQQPVACPPSSARVVGLGCGLLSALTASLVLKAARGC